MIRSAGKLPLDLGRCTATAAALKALEDADMMPLALLIVHSMGEWGDINLQDRAANDQAVIDHLPVRSAYRLRTGKTICIITDADRSLTAIFLPTET